MIKGVCPSVKFNSRFGSPVRRGTVTERKRAPEMSTVRVGTI